MDLIIKEKLVPRLCAALRQSMGGEFYAVTAFSAAESKTPRLEGVYAFDDFIFFVREKNIYFHEHEKAVDGIALFKEHGITVTGKTFASHKSCETCPKSFCMEKLPGKKNSPCLIAEHLYLSWSRVVLSSGPIRMMNTAGKMKSTTGIMILTGASLASFSAMVKRLAR